jgi:hypothetical protein
MSDRSCDRGPDHLRPVLHLPAPAKSKGWLQLNFESGIECIVPIEPRHIPVLVWLVDRWIEDDAPECFRGYTTRIEIGEHLREQSSRETIMGEQLIANKLSEITSAIRRGVQQAFHAAGQEAPAFDLFDRSRGNGYRIGPHGLAVHYR